MRILDKKEEAEVWQYFEKAAEIARANASCLKSQRGVIIVKNDMLLGEGYNAPPGGEAKCEYCLRDKFKNLPLGTEPCRAIHAEERAIIDASNRLISLEGATMYHIKIKNGEMVRSNDLSCTICSKLALENGLDFAMWTDEGVAVWAPKEFNDLTFEYVQKQLNKQK